ncbi:hypothetical protein CDV52_09465 [Haematobacter missouriensis]|uniref:Acyltransferase 3 domain-containing protein n=1 Tax=Haematobacter missouriensis TaxID=366616 RepID=A0A212ARG1_9RHOB|nr:acyltransferase family protein [Haematobacter missouriensis]OWJ84100.1 hypothetical protein CDV52_09465 [Haematobacter missouriensis]
MPPSQTSSPPWHIPPLSPEVSEAIRITRVLCILSMVSVHFWPGAGEILSAPVAPALHGFYEAVINYLGRGSVPLLSAISGVLLTISVSKAAYPLRLIASKIRALLVPMILWSLVMLAALLLHAVVTKDGSRLPATAGDWINSLFALTGPPVNEPLGFLRDVFLSAAIGILALALSRIWFAASIALLLVVTVAEVATGGILLLRPQILAFFTAGILLALAGVTHLRPGWLLVSGLLALDIVLRYVVGIPVGETGGLAYLARLTMSLVMWQVALTLRRSGGRLYRWAVRLEPNIFLVFGSHMLIILGVGFIARKIGVEVTSPAYPLVFLAQFPLVAFAGIAIGWLGARYAPGVLALFSGRPRGRSRRPIPA